MSGIQWHYIDKLSNETVPIHTLLQLILGLQPITKLYLFTIEIKLRDDFRCFRTFSTVPLQRRKIDMFLAVV